MSIKNMELSASTITEFPTDNRKSSSPTSLRKPQTPKLFKSSTEADTECNNQSKTMSNCKSPTDTSKFTKLNDYYKRPLVKMQTINNFSENGLKESNDFTDKTESSNLRIIKIERLIDYSCDIPGEQNILAHSTADFVEPKEKEFTSTYKKSIGYVEEFNHDSTSNEAFNISRRNSMNRAEKLSIDFTISVSKKVDKISEKSEFSSSNTESETPFKKLSTNKIKKYYNFLNDFQEGLASPEKEKKTQPLVKIDNTRLKLIAITNNYVHNTLETVKTPKEEVQSENWFFSSVMSLLGCGCGDKNR